MVCPFLKVAPAGIDWLSTLPLPVAVTFSPLFSIRYTASFNPIPVTAGMMDAAVVVYAGVFKTALAFFIPAALQ